MGNVAQLLKLEEVANAGQLLCRGLPTVSSWMIGLPDFSASL